LIAVDTNILVYSHRRDSEFHARAATAVLSLTETAEHWGVPWPCIHEFLAVVTHPRIFKQPTPLDRAINQVEIWLEAPNLKMLGESGSYWRTLAELLGHGSITGPKVHDARIAAICKTHGVRELWSADRDFSRIRGVKIRNPLLLSD
jgi:uncharacterized protein